MKTNGSLALVTGGAGGLGLAITQELLGKGAKVAVFDRDANALKRLPQEVFGFIVDVNWTPNNPQSIFNVMVEPTQEIIGRTGEPEQSWYTGSKPWNWAS